MPTVPRCRTTWRGRSPPGCPSRPHRNRWPRRQRPGSSDESASRRRCPGVSRGNRANAKGGSACRRARRVRESRGDAARARHAVPPACDGQVEIDGASDRLSLRVARRTLWLHVRDGDFAFHCQRRRPRRSATDRGCRARAGGRCHQRARARRCCVATGAEVTEGQRVMVLEAIEDGARAAGAARRPGREGRGRARPAGLARPVAAQFQRGA